jgi:hypothetical protein
MAAYRAQVAQNNAIIARQNAEADTAAGNARAEQAGQRSAATMGAILAGQGASGIDVNTGSAAAVQKSERMLSQEDALTIRSNAAMQAYGYQTQAATNAEQAALYGAEATNAPLAGDIGAGGTLLSGAASVGSKYAQWQLSGGK